MSYKIILYSPDDHIQYTAETPDEEGVGGGITARVRLALALAGLGHEVTVVGHVPRPHTHGGATFLPLETKDEKRAADVLLMISSGGQLDLASATSLPVRARLREVWLQGTLPVKGLDEIEYDVIIPASNFIRDVVRRDWNLKKGKRFVIYNGLAQPSRGDVSPGETLERDPFSLIYSSHPSKGLEAALAVSRNLREKDPRYTLHLYGGHRLWGEKEQPPADEPGVVYHGMVGQRELARAYLRASFSLHLQERREPFGISLVEAMGHGCIPLVSPVGAYRELVEDGYDGFWVEGEPASSRVHRRAAALIHTLCQSPGFSAVVRRNARSIPWTWETQARVWTSHWRHELDGEGQVMDPSRCHCPHCGGAWLLAADGYHCLGCGRYSRKGQ